MGRLENKVAVVTGGASGMGRSISILFAAEGASVVLVDIDTAGGESVLAEISDAGGRAVFHHADVTDEPSAEGMIRRAVDEFGKLDILHNNAGDARAIGFDAPIEDWDFDQKLNLWAPYFGMKYAVPEMRKASGGSIISTTSVSGFRALPDVHSFSSAKAGLIKLTESAAQSLGRDRIRVNAIAPGWIITPGLEKVLPGSWADAEGIGAKAQPIPRHGTPEDIARCALFLASDESDFITGVTIRVDGGWMVQGIQNSALDAEIVSVSKRTGSTPAWTANTFQATLGEAE